MAGKKAEKRHTATADMLHLVPKPNFQKVKLIVILWYLQLLADSDQIRDYY